MLIMAYIREDLKKISRVFGFFPKTSANNITRRNVHVGLSNRTKKQKRQKIEMKIYPIGFEMLTTGF